MLAPQTENPPPVLAGEGQESSLLSSGLTNKNTTGKPDGYTRARYATHSHIRQLLIVQAKKEQPEKHPGNVYRTAACTWVPIGAPAAVRPAGRESWHYKGLATCGSVWVCPICASKIQERRRVEVAAAVIYSASIDRSPVMVSYTFPHRLDQPLALLLRLQADAIKHLRGSRGYIASMLRISNAGRIRSLEVTHGQNGWHPHTHELLFVDPKMPAEWLRNELANLWLKACTKVGLFRPGLDDESAFLRHSVDVRAGDAGVSDYLAKLDDQSKWTTAHELTKSSSKQGKRTGRHPFALALQTSTSALFLEYVQAMKGQRQLVWSRGLKAAVGIEDKTDDEIAAEETEIAAAIIPITRAQWRVVVGNDARWELLHAAKTGGATGVADLLLILGHREPPP